MNQLTNAQAALQLAVQLTTPGGVNASALALDRAIQFKWWLDENTPKEETSA